MLRKVVAYYKRKHKKIKNQYSGYDLKLPSFKKTKHWIYKELAQFQKFRFLQNIYLKKIMFLKNYKIYYNFFQKQLFKNLFVWKSYFWTKGHVVLF